MPTLTCHREYDGPRATRAQRARSRWYVFYLGDKAIDAAGHWDDALGIATSLGYEFYGRNRSLKLRKMNTRPSQ